MMATGGWGTISASGMQLLGGAAQWVGGDATTGRVNMASGAINLAASATLIWGAKNFVTAGTSVVTRLFNSRMDLGAAMAGVVSDATSYLSPDLAPAHADCGP